MRDGHLELREEPNQVSPDPKVQVVELCCLVGIIRMLQVLAGFLGVAKSKLDVILQEEDIQIYQPSTFARF